MAKKAGKQSRRAVAVTRRKPPKTTADQRASAGGDSPLPADAMSVADHRSTPRQIAFGSRIYAGQSVRLADKKLDILPDMPDIRDRAYVPRLAALRPAIYPRIAFSVLNQGPDSSCTGFSLAHVIDMLRFREVGPDDPPRVSARMLYEMAKRNDEWDGSAYEGSSLRGAIKGFFRNGVCTERTAPDQPGVKDWTLTYEMAKEARNIRLGAYLRLQPDLTDYHAALNEVGVIYASAQIHANWEALDDGKITPGGKPIGGHAFAIVGYDQDGFWVLNSWGAEWGRSGIAHWDYTDWANTVMDAWVLQIGVPAPKAFGAVPRVAPANATGGWSFTDPARADILGHFINIDDGRLVTDGKYGSPQPSEMQETVKRLLSEQANENKGYDHLIIYAHGGLNDLGDEAKRIAAWQRNNIFGRNKIYNFHLMWGSGFIDEVFGQMSKSPTLGGAGSWAADWLFEAGPGKEMGAYAWRNMKQDARMAFEASAQADGYNGGFVGLQPLLDGIDKGSKTDPKRRPKLHLVGHSAGSIVLGYLLSAMKAFKLKNVELGSIHLMAPACTVDFFNTHYAPYLKGEGALKVMDKVYFYNLTDVAERADTVESSIPLTPYYSHSLLYLVSRAYEDRPANGAGGSKAMPLAGMQAFVDGLKKSAKLQIDYAATGSSITASKSHGGFDNDVATMSTIMTRILGVPVPHPPSRDDLSGY